MKKIQYLLIIITFLVCTSCLQGVLESSKSKSSYDIRDILVICSSDPDCSGESADENTLFVIYASSKCNDLDLDNSILARGSVNVECASSECRGEVNSFKASGGVEEKKYLTEGTYTLVSFIDLDDNESLDVGEPYFCSEELEISVKNNSSALEVSMSSVY